VLTATFEAGVNGNTIAATDAGSADAWDVVTIQTNATLKYDNARSRQTLAAKIVSAGGGPENAYMSWTTKWGTQTDHYGRLYINPDVTFQTDQVLQFSSGGTQAAALAIDTSNNVQLRDQANTVQAGGVTQLPLDLWSRIEWHVIHSTTVGQIEVKLFVGANANGTAPDETITTAASINTRANSDNMHIGLLSNDDLTFWLDNIVGAATSYPGPDVITTFEIGQAGEPFWS
jgi:hypothetical protein